MKNYRQTTSCWLTSQALCFCLLLQGSGIAEALPLPEKQEFFSQTELEAALAGAEMHSLSTPADESGGWLSSFWNAATETGDELGTWVRSSWSVQEHDQATAHSGGIQLASAGNVLPLPTRLMSAVMAQTGRGRNGPPNPPSMAKSGGPTPLANIEGLVHKDATEEIQLLGGYNLISIPEEPADSTPAAVFAGIADQLERVEAYDACDLADPWKLYDPADPGASDLTIANHEIGMWVRTNAPALLLSDGTLPATTTLQLCEGWNLIGFPAGQPRHPLAVLAPIADKWQRLFAYDVFDAEDPWEVYDPTVPDWANDLQLMHPGRGYWLLASEATTLEIRNQGPAPTIAITSPADLAVITAPTEITGTVESDRLENWTLTYRAIDGGDPVTLISSTAPVSGGTLATFDPTLLLNGLYELVLTATDVEGQQVTESIAVVVDGQMKVGHFTLSFIDLRVPVSGLDIEILRTYDSRDKRSGDFGIGWSLDIRQGSYFNNRPPGEGWQFQTGFLPCDTIIESRSHLTVVRLSDQEVYRFALDLTDGAPTGGGCFGTAHFDFVDGPLPGTTLEILGNDQVFYENGGDRVIDVESFELYEPQAVRLTTRDGRIFELDLDDGVTLLEDLSGNELSITPAGITHSSGQGIAFDRDAEGRIARITDPLGREMSYAYDTVGDLVTFTDRAAAITRFTYDDDHRLLDIEDPRGVKPIRNEYDAEGRLVRHVDAFGKVIELGHEPDNRREVVTDRLGNSRVLEYDGRGNVVRRTDELGNVTTRTFDGRDNVLTETDPLGRTTTSTYNSFNDILTLTDPLGNVTSYTYNSRGHLLTATDPRGGVTTNVYDAGGNLIRSTDAAGYVTSLSYDTRGNLLSATDDEGNVLSFEVDAFGNQIRETDALGNVTVSTYDAAGNRLTDTRTRTLPDGSAESLVTTFAYDSLDRVITTTAPDGSTTHASYDVLGRQTQKIDALGRVTTLTYDLMGRLVSTAYPDGTTEAMSYDDDGRIVSEVDRAGRTTTYLYDAAGRPTTRILPDGVSTSVLYDAAGQAVASTDARGNTTTFSYDAAGRQTTVVDPFGNSSTFAHDANGNRTSIIDARGNTTTLIYDAIDRLTTTEHPDGTSSVVGWDALGRRVSETDQGGLTTEFTYDPLGRLISVKDALEQATSYTYDEVGNRLTQIDANGNATRFEYDSVSRLTARELPDGARETMTYNADDTLASHTDFRGTTRTFEYDTNQRLTRRAYPDGSAVTFTYTPTGRRATAIDARGTTSYAYDSRDRLLEKTDPTGYGLSYTYDAHGNRTSLTATVGADVSTTTYGYDALNRLITVTDGEGGVTTFGYDLNGNQASLAHPNGVTTDYTYDALNRLQTLQTATSIDGVLASYAYTLGPAGHRTRVDEHDGTSRHYTYDDLYRLTQDRVTDAGAVQIYQRDFTYDAVGNRLQQIVDEGSGPTTIESTYDARDRLLTAAATSYAWDGNGNLSSRTDGGSTSYGWDFDDRLTTVTLDDGTLVATLYDADMNRVRSEVTPPGGPSGVIDYLVDTSGPLSHVVAEIVEGTVETFYTRANDQLIGLYRPLSGTQRYFHTDGLGSVRLLTDGSGAISDRYTYTAFGELLDHTGPDPQPYRFAGEPYDPNIGFYYNRARWMDPSAGRFASIDPFPGLLKDPSSLHRYLYARMDPVNRVDPTGELSTLNLAVTAAIVTGLAAATITALRGGSPREIFWNGVGVAGATFLVIYYGLPLLEGLIARYWPLLIAVGGGVAKGGRTVRRVLCFPPGTPVLMADGSTKVIEEVQEGDLVVAATPEEGAEVFSKKVVHTMTNKTMNLFVVAFDTNGDGEDDGEFEATSEHPIWTQNSGWRNAEDLTAGDLLQTHEGEAVTVLRIERKPGFSRTFNLTVEDAHTFFIVPNGVSILVHNQLPRIHGVAPDWATKGAHVTTSQGIEVSVRGGGSHIRLVNVFARDATNPQLGAAYDEVQAALQNRGWRARLLDRARAATKFLGKGKSTVERAGSGGTRALVVTLERWCK